MKECKNPWIIKFTKISNDRECPLTKIPYIERDDGSKGCVWCGDALKSNHPSTRYCKDPDCANITYMWGYPQKRESMFYLLEKQDFKCNDCNHDYKVYFDKKNYKDIKLWHYKRIRRSIPKELRPEVDHIIPIMKGGQSLGLDNHQVLCYTCHKKKTKEDIKGDKVKKDKLEIIKMKDERVLSKVLEKAANFQAEYINQDREEYNKAYQNIFLTALSFEELTALERDLKIKLNNCKNDKIQEFYIKKLNWVQDLL